MTKRRLTRRQRQVRRNRIILACAAAALLIIIIVIISVSMKGCSKSKKTDKNGESTTAKVEGGADTVLDAWIEYFGHGLLLLPTHTWKNINADSPVFNSKETPSCVGLLTNMFLKRDGVIRSLHPTHSMAELFLHSFLTCHNSRRVYTAYCCSPPLQDILPLSFQFLPCCV